MPLPQLTDGPIGHADLLSGTKVHPARPHNSMRFDVSFGHFYAMAEDDPTLKERLAKAIEAAIIKAANDVLEWNVGYSRQVGGEFLHHQQIEYELS